MFPVLKWRPVVTEGDSEARKGQITIRFKLVLKSFSSISTPHSQLCSELGSPCLWPEWSSSSSLRDVSVRPHSGRQDHLQQHFCQIQDQNTTILSSPVDDTEEHGVTHKAPTPGRIWNVSVIVSKIVMPGFDIKSWSIDVVMSIFPTNPTIAVWRWQLYPCLPPSLWTQRQPVEGGLCTVVTLHCSQSCSYCVLTASPPQYLFINSNTKTVFVNSTNISTNIEMAMLSNCVTHFLWLDYLHFKEKDESNMLISKVSFIWNSQLNKKDHQGFDFSLVVSPWLSFAINSSYSRESTVSQSVSQV